MRRLAGLLFLLFAAGSPSAALAQGAVAGPVLLAVYLDCHTNCDTDFIRTEINWVNWVRDRAVADVHVLITGQDAGAGGQELTLAFLPLKAQARVGDTLTFTTNPTTTSDERRKGLTRLLAVGLVPFVAKTPAARTLRIVRADSGGAGAPQASTTSDRWKGWVYEIEVNGSLNGERFYRGRDVNAQLSADRVTAEWKSDISYEYSYNDNRATVQEFDSLGRVTLEETFNTVRRDWEAQIEQIKSVTDHGGLGLELQLASQTFRNQRLRYSAQVAGEYNIFPYAQATRRELSFRYGLGVSGYRYKDTTIFNKIKETVPTHFIEASYRTRQPWGEASVNIEHRNMLTDASKRTTELNAFFSVRVFRGLSVNMGGGYNWIHDQIYLPRETQSTVDVLLRRRALLTGFEYFMHGGVSYTFGSIFKNVVNPRF